MPKTNRSEQTRNLFADPQGDLLETSFEEQRAISAKQPVECLGITFPSDHARRQHFLKLLTEKLKSPDLRKIEGFPLGKDKDILALSDPPYYTACPNPWAADFIAYYGRPFDPGEQLQKREPYAADVSEGKNDPLYQAHTYHTKVPHKAIMRYMLHYTNPGDIVLDAFSGTGMVGVAATLCGYVPAIKSLGYDTTRDGRITNTEGLTVSRIGQRLSILQDLSPLSSYISSKYLQLSLVHGFAKEALQAVEQAEHDLVWLYQHPKGKVLSAVWSDVFSCPNCGTEIVLWDETVAKNQDSKSFQCPACQRTVGKAASEGDNTDKLARATETIFEKCLSKTVTIPKTVLISEDVKTSTGRRALRATAERRKQLSSLLAAATWSPVPSDQFFEGRQTNKLINGTGIRYVIHMYTPRALYAYAYLWQLQLSRPSYTDLFRFCLTGINNYISRKQGYFGGGGGVAGTLYVPPIHSERNVFDVLKRKIKKLSTVSFPKSLFPIAGTQSCTDSSNLPPNSIDYVFTDPPFGESLQYAELNFFAEAWLRVFTNAPRDCVLNYVHKKDLAFYSASMAESFRQYHRVLKPGRWITIEFHNSQNAVWSAIQQGLEVAGLVVADVRVLDKQQRGFNAVNRAGAVDKDLVITAYKPNGGLEERFKVEGGREGGVWDFVRTHLRQLPVFVLKQNKAELIVERQSQLLFDRMIAFHVQRGSSVPISASDFYSGLAQHFMERESMFFLPEQVIEFDKARSQVESVEQMDLIITDEEGAIKWLRQSLAKKPQTINELTPPFMRELAAWDKHEKGLELRELLEQNFLCYNSGEVPSQIHTYLSSNFKELRNLAKDDPVLQAKAKDRWFVPDPRKLADLDKSRERALLKEFETYRSAPSRKLKVFRMEAVRAGFKKAWQDRDYATIMSVAKAIDESVVQEDPKLLMWYTNAVTRGGVER